ncbi:g7263 [Coccomyxa elongata]
MAQRRGRHRIDVTRSLISTGSPGVHSRQLLAQDLPAVSACPSPSWQCHVNSTQASVIPEVFDLVRAAPQNCTSLSNTMLCGRYLLDLGLYTAIKSDACQLGCISSAAPGCAVPPTMALPYANFKALLPAAQPTLAPVPVLAPAPAPAQACPPQPQPGCSRWEHVCGDQRQYRIADAQYNALHAAHSCAADLDVSFCFVGRFVVEALVFDAVKGETCTRECLEGVSLPTCPAAGLVVSPDLAPVEAPALGPTISLYGVPAPASLTSKSIAYSQAQVSTTHAQAGPDLTPRYKVQVGPLGECSATCGGGLAQRSLSCIDAALGLPAELSKCGACEWVAGDWSTCGATCGTGTAMRTIQCMSGGLAVAPGSAQCGGGCSAAAAPVVSKPCAAATACTAVMWQTGAWSVCQSGSATRSVTCIDGQGSLTASEECTRALGEAPEAVRMCGLLGCTSDAACLNGGTCNVTAAACACRPGFAGPTCSISLGDCAGGNAASPLSGPLNASSPLCCATGVVDKQGACCSSGVVSNGGVCCVASPGAAATLDRAGQCCASGQLDVCGTCGGNATAVDITGACCAGSLDAGGRCCPAPAVLDEFGVCGGRSSSGVLALNLATTTNSTQGLGDSASSEYAAYSQRLLTDLGARLGVNATQISLKALTLPSTASRRLLSSDIPIIDGIVQAAATSHPSSMLDAQNFAFVAILGAAGSKHLAHAVMHPSRLAHGRALAQDSSAAAVDASVWVIPPYGPLTYAQLLLLLNGTSSEHGSAVSLSGIRSFSKSGLADNGLCELGELPTADSPGVPSDCPLTYQAVPADANRTTCSSHGMPVAAQGLCQCYIGYDGPACGSCGDGYWPSGGLCQRTLSSFQAEAALAGRNALVLPSSAPAPAPAAAAKNAAASLAAPLIASLLGAFLVLALVAIIWVVVSRRRKRRAAELPVKAPAVESTKGSLQDPEKGNTAAAASQVGGTEAKSSPQRHAISMVSDSTSAHVAPAPQMQRASFFGLFGGQPQPIMQPDASHVSDSSSAGSVSSVTSARRRSHAMGSMTFASPSDAHGFSTSTSRRNTFSYVQDCEASGAVKSHPLRQSSSPRSLHSGDSQNTGATQNLRQSKSFGSGSSCADKGKAPMQHRDIFSHHVSLTDSSEVSSNMSSPTTGTRPASFVSDQ